MLTRTQAEEKASLGGCEASRLLPSLRDLISAEPPSTETSSSRPRAEAVEGYGAPLAEYGSRVRRRLVQLVLGEAALAAVSLFLVGAGAVMLADALWELPRAGRLGAVLGLLLSGAFVLVRRGGIPFRRLPDGDALMLLIERRRPELRSRLISAVQLGRAVGGVDGDSTSPETRAFISRLVEDAAQASRLVEWETVVPFDPLRARARRVGWMVAMGLGIAVVAWPLSGVLLRRFLLVEVPLPRQTRLVEVTGARTVGRGDDLTLVAVAEGVRPKTGSLVMRQSTGRMQTLALEADPERPGRYERVLANLPSSFSYRVRINDAESPEYRVEVLPRPAVTNLELTLALPSYTGRPARRVTPSELSLLRGSRLRIAGQATQPLARADLRLAGVDRTVGAVVDSAEPRRFGGEILVDGGALSGFSLDLLDAKGVGSRDPAVFALEVVPDRPPQVRVLVPARREELVTTRSEVLVAMEVADDFGLASLRLLHQPAGSPQSAPMVMDLDLTGETNAVVRRRFEWKLAALRPPLADGALVEFWIEAADRNTVDGPGIGRSERYLLRVVSEAEKRADLLGRAGDAIGRLGDVAQGQERLNDSLGRIILARPAAGSPPSTLTPR